jgi:hypothetical protein
MLVMRKDRLLIAAATDERERENLEGKDIDATRTKTTNTK